MTICKRERERRQNNKKKLISLGLLMSSLSFAIVTSSCSITNNSNNESNTYKNEFLKLKHDFLNPNEKITLSEKSKEYDLRSNSENLRLDAIEKAKQSNNVIFYSINWLAVLHKYGFISHMLKILEINKNKEVYIFSREQQLETLLKPILDNKNDFPNIHFIPIQWNNWDTFKFHFPEMEPIVQKVISENKVIDAYFDDYALLQPLSAYINKWNEYQRQTITKNELNEINKTIFNNYKLLFKLRSINLIADGTASWNFYEEKYFNFLNESNIGFDPITKCFPILNYIRQKAQNDKNDEYWNLILDDEINSGGIILWSLISSIKKINNIQQSKYFVAGTNTILDFNSPKTNKYPSTMVLQKTIDQGFWDPYYSINAKIIDLYKSFSLQTRKLFLEIIGIQEQSKQILQNKTSVIYSGILVEGNDTTLTNECNKILKLYKLHSNANTNVQVVYKAHPREWSNYQELIKNKLSELEPTFDTNLSLNFLDKSVPMEYYIMEGYTISDESINSKVIYYSGYSTTVYFLDAEDLGNTIHKVIIDANNFELIKKWNGYPSRVFPDEKLITSDLLFN